jgi:hypothetical protein
MTTELITPTAPDLAGAFISAPRAPERTLELNTLELEALLGAVDDRLESASPDLVGILSRGRRALELELARRLAE